MLIRRAHRHFTKWRVAATRRVAASRFRDPLQQVHLARAVQVAHRKLLFVAHRPPEYERSCCLGDQLDNNRELLPQFSMVTAGVER